MRVWIYANDWTKVNVPDDGTPIHFETHHVHDEGWSSLSTRLWIEEDALQAEYYSDGRDCDGRMSTYTHCIAPIDGGVVRTEPCEYAPTGRRIAWERAGASQRDYSAEAMGY